MQAMHTVGKPVSNAFPRRREIYTDRDRIYIFPQCGWEESGTTLPLSNLRMLATERDTRHGMDACFEAGTELDLPTRVLARIGVAGLERIRNVTPHN
jgi:hypothetical protein